MLSNQSDHEIFKTQFSDKQILLVQKTDKILQDNLDMESPKPNFNLNFGIKSELYSDISDLDGNDWIWPWCFFL